MRKYKLMNLFDRKVIALRYEGGERPQDIADLLGVHVSTIYRELKRGYCGGYDANRRPTYDPVVAQIALQTGLKREGRKLTYRSIAKWWLANDHGYCHRLILGLILRESAFRTDSHNEYGNWQGLTQIHPSWARNRLVAPYRLTGDYAQRSLFDPREHLLTLIEIWNYARSAYGIDSSTEQGMREILWWHMSGRFIEGADHHEICRVFRFADELVENPDPTRLSPIFLQFSRKLHNVQFQLS